jgi:hypothetical protein
MPEDLYTNNLAWFKSNERPEVVLLIADNPNLIKIAVAWTSLTVKRTDKLTVLHRDTENEIWQWLWQNTQYCLSELKEKIAVPYSEISLHSKLRTLIGNRIIYPDGTINSFVQRYLREKVIGLFGSRSDRIAKKEK